MKKCVLLGFAVLATQTANAWEAKVTNVLQHGTMIAIYSVQSGPAIVFGGPALPAAG